VEDRVDYFLNIQNLADPVMGNGDVPCCFLLYAKLLCKIISPFVSVTSSKGRAIMLMVFN
jgi:hypothetical protein